MLKDNDLMFESFLFFTFFPKITNTTICKNDHGTYTNHKKNIIEYGIKCRCVADVYIHTTIHPRSKGMSDLFYEIWETTR
jgi:hypothetical protein